MKKLVLMIALVGIFTIGALPALANMACAMQGVESFNVALYSDFQAQESTGGDLSDDKEPEPIEPDAGPGGGGGHG